MPVNQKISIPSVFVLANTGLHHRRILQRRESPRNIGTRPGDCLWAYDAGLCVGIRHLAVSISREFQPTALQVRHSIYFVGLKQPGRQTRSRKSRIAWWNAKEKHFLPSWENAWSEQLRENFAEPRAAGKDKLPAGNMLAMRGFDAINAVAPRGRRDLRDFHLHPQTPPLADHAIHS